MRNAPNEHEIMADKAFRLECLKIAAVGRESWDSKKIIEAATQMADFVIGGPLVVTGDQSLNVGKLQ